MLERAMVSFFFAALLLALSEASPLAVTLLWLWVGDALRAWILHYHMMSNTAAIPTSLVAASFFIFGFVWLATLGFVLWAEKRASD